MTMRMCNESIPRVYNGGSLRVQRIPTQKRLYIYRGNVHLILAEFKKYEPEARLYLERVDREDYGVECYLWQADSFKNRYAQNAWL